MSTSALERDSWFSVSRYEHDGRVLDSVVLDERPSEPAFLVDGIVDLVSRLRDVADAPRGPDHAGAAVVFRLAPDPEATVALAAVRGFVLSAAQELGSSLRLNLVVHEDGGRELEETLRFLADPLSSYVHAATIVIGGVEI